MPNFDFNFSNVSKKDIRLHGDYGKIYKNSNVAYGSFSKYGSFGAIYGIKSKTTNKVYVGSTKNIQLRLGKHFNELYHNRHANKKLQQDFNNYGFDDFDIIIYESTRNDLLNKEVNIQLSIGIENLYNEKITGHYVDEEYRKRLASVSKDSHKTKEYREKMSKLKTNKIGQFSFMGELIKIWDSAIQVCEECGYTRSVILSCCNRNKPHAYGYNWRYVDDEGNIILDGYAKARKK